MLTLYRSRVYWVMVGQSKKVMCCFQFVLQLPCASPSEKRASLYQGYLLRYPCTIQSNCFATITSSCKLIEQPYGKCTLVYIRCTLVHHKALKRTCRRCAKVYAQSKLRVMTKNVKQLYLSIWKIDVSQNNSLYMPCVICNTCRSYLQIQKNENNGHKNCSAGKKGHFSNS